MFDEKIQQRHKNVIVNSKKYLETGTFLDTPIIKWNFLKGCDGNVIFVRVIPQQWMFQRNDVVHGVECNEKCYGIILV